VRFSLPRYLLFDLDGTLLDSLPGVEFSVSCALEAAGLPQTNVDLKCFLGPPIRTILSKIVRTEDPVLLNRLEVAFRESYDAEGWQKSTCYPGAHEVLVAMRTRGHRLVVVSNKPRRVSLRILEREGLLPLFERIYTRDSQIPACLSKDEMLTKVLRDMEISPSECLMIGDTMEDVAAAASNEIGMVLMEHGYGNLAPGARITMRLKGLSDFLEFLNVERTQ